MIRLLLAATLAVAQNYSNGMSGDVARLDSDLSKEQRAYVIGTTKPLLSLAYTIDLHLNASASPCPQAEYDKLVTKFGLRNLVALASRTTIAASSLSSKLRETYLDRLTELWKKGELKKFPELERDLRARASPEAQKYRSSLKNGTPERDYLADLERDMKKVGVQTKADDFVRDFVATAPSCATMSGSFKLQREFIEPNRMKEEAKRLIQLLAEKQKKTGQVETELPVLDDGQDPIMRHVDAWHHRYLLEDMGTRIRLLSLGPDGMKSADDIVLGEFTKVPFLPAPTASPANFVEALTQRKLSEQELKKTLSPTPQQRK